MSSEPLSSPHANPWLSPRVHVGFHARLVPLSHEHHDGLVEAVQDGRLWELWYTVVPSPEDMRSEIDRRLGLQALGSMLPFTVIDPNTDRIVGMTTYMNVEAEHRRLEIGSTWYASSAQRTALNTDAKRLLLRHAFEELDCIAVEFRTSFYNTASRRAIERLGARLDGTLRNHRTDAEGRIRDTCVYSIIAPEWPAVRARLADLLGRNLPLAAGPLRR